MNAYIVIAVMILMVIAFVLNKWPFGLITMTCFTGYYYSNGQESE